MLKLLLLSLALSHASADDHAKYAPHVTRLSRSHDYVAKHAAPDFWKLIPYYVPQKDGGSCAAASLSMVLNAMRADADLKASDRLITQADLYSKIDVFKEGGDSGIRGVSLDGFGRVLAAAMKKFSIDGWSYEVVRADRNDALKKKVHELLAKNEKSGEDFIVPLFLQKDLTGDPEGAVGHFAPVAAYDGKRVLVLDPDREWYEPYWVPEEVFFEGISDSKADSIKPGGYVHIFKKQ
jgi:hypothetical protein